MESPRIRRALVSVSDKLGLGGFARGLAAAGVEIYSTGGTRKHLEQEGIGVRDVSEYTGFPEMMEGRLKTLHPKVHGGILARHDNPQDMESAAQHGILTFELVVVNLYPFQTTVARKGVTWDEAIEQIDIGGPAMVRAAAKNHAFTTIATNDAILGGSRPDRGPRLHDGRARRRLAGEAFAHTAEYDRAIADFFAGQRAEGPFPGAITLSLGAKWCSATARTLTSKRRSTPGPSAAARAWPWPGNCTARSSPTTTCWTSTCPGDCPPVCRAGGRGDQAQQPLRRRGGREAGCRAAAGDGRRSAAPSARCWGSTGRLTPPPPSCCTPGLFVEAMIAPHFDDAALEILTTRPKWKNNVRLMEAGDSTGRRRTGLTAASTAGC